MFKNPKSDDLCNDYFNMGLLMLKGTIKIIDCDLDEEVWALSPYTAKINGKIIQTISDWKQNKSHYFLTEENGKRNLYGFSEDSLVNLGTDTVINGIATDA